MSDTSPMDWIWPLKSCGPTCRSLDQTHTLASAPCTSWHAGWTHCRELCCRQAASLDPLCCMQHQGSTCPMLVPHYIHSEPRGWHMWWDWSCGLHIKQGDWNGVCIVCSAQAEPSAACITGCPEHRLYMHGVCSIQAGLSAWSAEQGVGLLQFGLQTVSATLLQPTGLNEFDIPAVKQKNKTTCSRHSLPVPVFLSHPEVPLTLVGFLCIQDGTLRS